MSSADNHCKQFRPRSGSTKHSQNVILDLDPNCLPHWCYSLIFFVENSYWKKLSRQQRKASDVCWCPLQTVWAQIRPNILLGLIWVQTYWYFGWYSWKNFLKKRIFKKTADDKQKLTKLPNLQRVKSKVLSQNIYHTFRKFDEISSIGSDRKSNSVNPDQTFINKPNMTKCLFFLVKHGFLFFLISYFVT